MKLEQHCLGNKKLLILFLSVVGGYGNTLEVFTLLEEDDNLVGAGWFTLLFIPFLPAFANK